MSQKHRHFLVRVLVYLQALQVICAQQPVESFAIPAQWRKPTTTLSLNQRYTLTTAIINSFLPLFNTTDGLIDDLSFNENGHSSQEHGNGHKPEPTRICYEDGFNSDAAQWALAAVEAAIAYNSTEALHSATNIWEQLNEYTVQPSDAAKGSHPRKTMKIQPTCNGSTTAGGLFYVTSETSSIDVSVNVETVGDFMTLSSYLATVTSNQTYAAAAELSAEFIWNHLFNGTIILDTLDLGTCDIPSYILSYNSGKTIEGLSDIARKNSTWTSRLNSLISTSTPFSTWTSSTGINIEGQGGPTLEDLFLARAEKVFIIRGLYAAWAQNDPNSDMAQYIQAYITVQFNALQDLATIAGSNIYNSVWQGPPSTSFLPWGQLCALEVMKSEYGFGLQSQDQVSSATSSIGASDTTASTAQNSTSAHLNKAAVIGGTVGGIALLTISIAALVLCCRYRRRGDDETAHKQTEFIPVPFDTLATQVTSTVREPKAALPSNSSAGAVARSAAFSTEAISDPHVELGDRAATSRVGSAHHTDHDQRATAPSHFREQDFTTLMGQLSRLLARVPQEREDAPPAYDE